MDKLNSVLGNNLEINDFKKPVYVLLTTILLSVSISYSIEHFPQSVKSLFDNNLTRFLIFTLAFYVNTNDIRLSIISGLLFLVIFMLLFNFKEHFKNSTNVHPNCVDITVNDLLKAFADDKRELKVSMYNSGVPLNLPLNDNNAPEIATYLINNKELSINEKCKM